ncbi:MAG: hypothetical protein V1701_03040 [Planctomycetota bacterium]
MQEGLCVVFAERHPAVAGEGVAMTPSRGNSEAPTQWVGMSAIGAIAPLECKTVE